MIHIGEDGKKFYVYTPGETLLDVKKQVIALVLEQNHGNATHTALCLGLGVRSLRIWRRRHPEIDTEACGHRLKPE